jgi:hypothetical protein
MRALTVEMNARRRTVHEIRDDSLELALMTTSIVFDWDGEEKIPLSTPPLSRIKSTKSCDLLALIKVQLSFPFSTAQETQRDHQAAFSLVAAYS